MAKKTAAEKLQLKEAKARLKKESATAAPAAGETLSHSEQALAAMKKDGIRKG